MFEEIAVRGLQATLKSGLPAILAELSNEPPDVGALPPPRDEAYYFGEVVDVVEFPTVVCWTSGNSSRESHLVYSHDRSTLEQFIDLYVDVYLEWDTPEALYFRLLRYKCAIRECIRRNPTLGGAVMGSNIMSSQNSNLFSGGSSLNQAVRLHIRALTTDSW